MKANKKQQGDQKARRQSKRRAFTFVGNIQRTSTAKFGAALRQKRLSIGMTQSELAQLSGLNRSYISEIESGRESISLDRAGKLAKAVGSSLSDLLKEEQENQ